MKKLILAAALMLLALPAMADEHDAFFHSLEAIPAAEVEQSDAEVGLAVLTPEPVQLTGHLCEPMPPLCEATNMEQEYCDCVAAGGNSGFCRCRWCLGASVEDCKVYKFDPDP